MMKYLYLFLIIALFTGCSQNKVEDTPRKVEDTPPKPQEQTVEFNKDLFSAAYRAAATLHTSSKGEDILNTELVIIEPQLQTESERAVHVLLTKYLETKYTLIALRKFREDSLKQVVQIKNLPPDAINVMRAHGGAKGVCNADLLEETVQMVDAGYVQAYSKNIPATKKVLEVIQTYKFPIKECKCCSWVPYEDTTKTLEAASYALWKTASEMIYNNGKVKE